MDLRGLQNMQEKQTEINEVTFTITCVGDVTLGSNQKQAYEGSFHEYYDRFGGDYFFKNVKDIFQNSDCTIANFEGVLTESEVPRKKRFNHKGRPEYASILPGAYVGCVSLANNHIIDYRKIGARDTMRLLKAHGTEYAICGDYGVRHILYETKNGAKIGIVSVNVLDNDERNEGWLSEGIETLRRKGAAVVVAAIHWGVDKSHEVQESQEILGHWCIDHGYDLVVGCHAHVLQGIEQYKGKYIVYNLGNFCYGGHWNPKDKNTMIYQQTFTVRDGNIVSTNEAKIIPCTISGHEDFNDYCPIPVTGTKGEQIINLMNDYSKAYGIQIRGDGIIEKKVPGCEGDCNGLE